jgi:hypothetical protein
VIISVGFYLNGIGLIVNPEGFAMERILTFRQTGSSSSYVGMVEENNVQFSAVLEAAIKRSGDAVSFLRNRGEKSRRIINRAFYLYLSVKKDAQRAILEKIAYSLGLEKVLAGKDRSVAGYSTLNENDDEEEYGTIFKLIYERAADEFEFYLNYAAVEKEPRIRSLIYMLADLSKEFLFDVKIWYLNHKDSNCYSNAGMQEKMPFDTVVETVLN